MGIWVEFPFHFNRSNSASTQFLPSRFFRFSERRKCHGSKRWKVGLVGWVNGMHFTFFLSSDTGNGGWSIHCPVVFLFSFLASFASSFYLLIGLLSFSIPFALGKSDLLFRGFSLFSDKDLSLSSSFFAFGSNIHLSKVQWILWSAWTLGNVFSQQNAR